MVSTSRVISLCPFTIALLVAGCDAQSRGNGRPSADARVAPSDGRGPDSGDAAEAGGDATDGASTTTLDERSYFENATGTASTYSINGPIDLTDKNLFFKSLGTNGRSCGSCHVPAANWTIAPSELRERFEKTDGTDPVFRPVDGANSPNADVSTVSARRASYSMLLTKGLIRIGLPVPADGELELVAVDDPYGFASASELSLFRRPLPSTNLPFLTTTMWDGRESTPVADSLRGPNNGTGDLATQSNHAVVLHAQGKDPVPEIMRAQIVAFELGLFTAQSSDGAAGLLTGGGALGGPTALASQAFYFGINDAVAGDSTTRAPFDPRVFTIYGAWSSVPPSDPNAEARKAVQRGEDLFNNKPITITGVRGVNDVLGVSNLAGHCTTCHDSPNVGHHSVRFQLDLGLTDASRRTPDLPLYTFCKRKSDASGAPVPGSCDPDVPQIQTTDPGHALVTGKWAHMSIFKGPILRGLAGRPPYFHNGFAASLAEVVKFYNTRFAIQLSTQEAADLVAFLQTL